MGLALSKIRGYGELVMFSHSLFTLPFGLLAMIWAFGGFPPVWVFAWILVALFSARTGANAFNRIADRFIDAKNARTADRHMPTGTIKLIEAAGISLICLTGVCVAAYMLNPTCLVLLPFAAALLIIYSYTKRFTWLCHFVLGAANGCGPVGAWIAINGSPDLFVPLPQLLFGWFDIVPVLLGIAITFYVSGFDIIYAIQDIEFDRREGLHSVPARFGAKGAMIIASGSHFIAGVLFLSLFFIADRGILYLIAAIITAILLFIQNYSAFYVHLYIKLGKKSKLLELHLIKKFAEYGINRIVSVVFFVFAIADSFVVLRL